MKWVTTDIEYIGNFKIFDAYYKTRINPKTGNKSKFTSLEASNWVNIIAITP